MSRIHLSRADVTEVEERFVIEAIRSGWVAPAGPMIERFEAEVASQVGVRGAVALSSGTAALHLALLHLGAGPDTVVILPTMTFAASANAVVYTGAEPVFIDSQDDDANVDVDLVVEAVDTLRSEGRDIACVISVDLYGRCADYTRLIPALAERGVPLLEDAAEALGARSGLIAAGAFGRAGALSFNGNKIITTSGGGMLVSDDMDILERARYLSSQARQHAPWYEHTEVGYNYRMSNVLAALGVAQLSRLGEMMGRRRAHRESYANALSAFPGIRILGRGSAEMDAQDNCWLTSIVLGSELTVDATDIIHHLDEQGIEARHFWKPMHMQPAYSGARVFGGRTSEHLFARGVNLPSGSELTSADIDRVVTTMASVFDLGNFGL